MKKFKIIFTSKTDFDGWFLLAEVEKLKPSLTSSYSYGGKKTEYKNISDLLKIVPDLDPDDIGDICLYMPKKYYVEWHEVGIISNQDVQEDESVLFLTFIFDDIPDAEVIRIVQDAVTTWSTALNNLKYEYKMIHISNKVPGLIFLA